MRCLVHVAIVFLLIVSFSVNVAEAADVIPCSDAPQATVTTFVGPATVRHPAKTPLHCAVVWPFAAAILAQRPAIPCGPHVAGLFALPANVVDSGLCPTPMHGPPRT
jgi:hypothetical protein